MIRRPPRSTQSRSSAASDVYKRQPLKRALTISTLNRTFRGWQQAQISEGATSNFGRTLMSQRPIRDSAAAAAPLTILMIQIQGLIATGQCRCIILPSRKRSLRGIAGTRTTATTTSGLAINRMLPIQTGRLHRIAATGSRGQFTCWLGRRHQLTMFTASHRGHR